MVARALVSFFILVTLAGADCQDTPGPSSPVTQAKELFVKSEAKLKGGESDSALYFHQMGLNSVDDLVADAGSRQWLSSHAESLAEKGAVTMTIDIYERLLSASGLSDQDKDQIVSKKAWAQVVVGEFEAAISGYRSLLSEASSATPSFGNWSSLLAYCYLNVGLVDSANHFIDLSRRTADTDMPMAIGSQGILQFLAGDGMDAISSLEAAIQMAKATEERRFLTGLYRYFAEALLIAGLEEEARLVVDSAILNVTHLTPQIEVVESYRVYSAVLKELGAPDQALAQLETYLTMRDSLFSFQSSGGLPVGRSAGLAEDQARIAQRLEIAAEELARQRNWIIVLVITLFVALFFSVRYLRTLRKSKWAYTKLQESNRKVVTQSKEIALAQEEIIKSEKMAFLGRVFAGVGHELNTPIAAVKSNLQLIEDSQMQEIRKLKELANVFNPEILEQMTDLIIASYQAQQNPLSTVKQRALKKTLRSYFQEELDGDPYDIADIFDDLKVYDGLKQFEPIYRHDMGVDILELVMFISNRTRSIFTAMEALQRADKILFSLKSYSFKNLHDKKVQFDLIRNINNIITLHQNKLKNVTVYKQFEESVEIEGYPDELTQVWTNLISNATYANKYRGNLWIRVKQYDDKVQVDIEDSGGGIDPKVKERIFEPFETTKPEGEGTGLGLSITKRVIDKHKGTISVENTATGALFSVTLPKNLS